MRSTIRGIATAGIVVMACSVTMPAHAVRHYTITQRQTALKKDIDTDVKTGSLTLKEATSLKDELADITAKEVKMKNANGGKLSVEDDHKLEGDLNKVSLKLKKKELKKRTEK
jgi:methionine-rich copper-binding protein CopC